MQNLIEHSWHYSEATGSLWFYSKDEATDFNKNIANTDDFKSLDYKNKLLGNTVGANRILKIATIDVSLKYVSSFWRPLAMPLINCKVELKLKYAKYWVLFAADADNRNANSNNAIFTIKSTESYVTVVTSPAKDNQKLSKLLSKGFERSVY